MTRDVARWRRRRREGNSEAATTEKLESQDFLVVGGSDVRVTTRHL